MPHVHNIFTNNGHRFGHQSSLDERAQDENRLRFCMELRSVSIRCLQNHVKNITSNQILSKTKTDLFQKGMFLCQMKKVPAASLKRREWAWGYQSI